MGKVTLYDGREVDTCSEDWRQQCEVNTILAMPLHQRDQFWQGIERHRGADALAALKARCYELEPHYVINLPNKPQRTHYLEQVEHRFGHNPRKALEGKIMVLHRARLAVATETTNTA